VRWVAGVAGVVLLAVVLWDAFETIILPRRVSGRIRLTSLFYRSTWKPWRGTARLLSGRRRDAFLSFYGPLSLILLLALWAAGIVFAFGLLQWAAGSALTMTGGAPSFGADVYMSGTTFFTLGLGDVVPRTTLAKVLTTVEAGMGFAFLAVVIGYFPVIYQAFSRREVAISLLDARAGSPPSAAELLWRHRGDPGAAALADLLREWERWSADVLESHLSYPPLAYFRSQHYNESWVAALTTILDTSAIVIVGLEGWCVRQAELTFAMARHAVVDLAQVFSTPPGASEDRLSPADLARLRDRLASGGLRLKARPDFDVRLAELRRMYEPYVVALARHLALPLPPWMRAVERPDNWQTSAWDPMVRLPTRDPAPAAPPPIPAPGKQEEHF
jgi:Ion channel